MTHVVRRMPVSQMHRRIDNVTARCNLGGGVVCLRNEGIDPTMLSLGMSNRRRLASVEFRVGKR